MTNYQKTRDCSLEYKSRSRHSLLDRDERGGVEAERESMILEKNVVRFHFPWIIRKYASIVYTPPNRIAIQ